MRSRTVYLTKVRNCLQYAKEQSAVPRKVQEKLKRFQNFQKQRKPKLPRHMSINQKLGKNFPQIKIKENQKQQVSFPGGVANLLAG